MDYLLHVGTLASIYSLTAIGLNYAVGFTGLVSVSHGAFMGIGAYVSAFLLKSYDLSFSLSVLMAAIITALVAWIVSVPLLKLKEDAFVLVSFGFAFIATNVFLNWNSFTNGALGIKGISGPVFPDWMGAYNLAFFVTLLLVIAIVAIFLWKLLRSPYGVLLKASREQQHVAQVFGHNTWGYRRSAYVLSAAIVAVSGAFLASYITTIDPVLFHYHLSVLLLVMVILGGLASLKGAVVGATLLMILPELLRFIGLPNSILAESQQILYGVALIVLMVWRPVGLFGKFRI